MNKQRVEQFLPFIDRKLMVAGVKHGDHDHAIDAIKKCVMGEMMAKAYRQHYMD